MKLAQSLLLLFAITLFPGCHAIRITEPQRTATEQLLMSTATDHAVRNIDLSLLKERKVFFDQSYFDSYDDGYAVGSLRELISKSGGCLVKDRDSAEVVVEARSGTLGIDSRDALAGLPELAIPLSFAGQVQSPEISLYKAQKADSVAKFALLVYETPSGEFLHATGPLVGKAKFYHYKILGFLNWRRTDIPEQKPGY
ncbi:MAG: hypothetical protein M2R45_01662 [Verrucomicrobia subdivision 3 bacterium]|nr:hypothetical protein [Limisphaerales bacterium]MCS1412813.1 hypothetical protein [Limisphaerales bacterium]